MSMNRYIGSCIKVVHNLQRDWPQGREYDYLASSMEITFYGKRMKYIGEQDKSGSPNMDHLEDLWATQEIILCLNLTKNNA